MYPKLEHITLKICAWPMRNVIDENVVAKKKSDSCDMADKTQEREREREKKKDS